MKIRCIMLDIINRISAKWGRLSAICLLLLAACSANNIGNEDAEIEPPPKREPAEKYEEYTIVTLLPRDGIPAIDNPQFLGPAEADDFYDPDELVIGVEFEGDARAYSVPFLSGHEIVNDTVGGRKIAVTW